MRMATHFQTVNIAQHPLSIHCCLPVRGSDLSQYQRRSVHFPYVQQGRMYQCVSSTKHLIPTHKFAMVGSELPGLSDNVNRCERYSQANRSCPSPTVLQETAVIPRDVSRKGDCYEGMVLQEERISTKNYAVSVTYGLRGIKRPTENALWSPHQKKCKSSSVERSASESVDSYADEQAHTCRSVLSTDLGIISEQILSVCATKQQCKDVYVCKMKLRDALYDVIKGIFPYCGLYVIGSSMNGFGNSTSDIDLCLMLSHTEIDQKREAMEILHILRKSLLKCSFLRDIRVIHARVPILKFTDDLSSLECDLNINNSVGIRNTHLLNAYSCLDWRLAPLVVFVKHWAKIQGINDACQGTISSYSLVLMIIHYLQYGCQPPVLPSLQQKYPHKFNRTQDVRVLTLNQKLAPYASPNRQPIGELLMGFLNYFAYVFKFDDEVISVRLGRTLRKNLLIQQLNIDSHIYHQWKYLCIEEPFSLSNTAYSVHDTYTFERIKRVFLRSSHILQETGDVQLLIKGFLVPF